MSVTRTYSPFAITSKPPLIRPTTIAPSTDGAFVQTFKKIPVFSNKPASHNTNIPLRGLWETIVFERGGAKFHLGDSVQPPDAIEFYQNRRVFYFHDGFQTLMTGGKDKGLTTATLRQPLLPKAGKQAIDFHTEDGTIIPAIYQQQDNELTICWNANGGERPDQFSTENDDGRALWRLKRVDKEK